MGFFIMLQLFLVVINDSIRGCVRPLVHWLVGPSVGRSFCNLVFGVQKQRWPTTYAMYLALFLLRKINTKYHKVFVCNMLAIESCCYMLLRGND